MTAGDLVYFGSTKQKLNDRFSKHKRVLNCTSKVLFESGYEVNIELLETCNVNDRYKRERYYVDNFVCVNNRVPDRTQKEYYEQNKEQKLQRMKEYREQNKEQLLQKSKEQFECPCGGRYTRYHKSRHLKSKKHQDYLQRTGDIN